MIPLIPPALSPFSIAFYRNKFPELSILIVSVFSLPILYKTNFLVSLIPIASKPLLSMSSQSPPLINLMVNSQPLSYFRTLDMVDHFLLFEIFSSLSFQYTTFSCFFFFLYAPCHSSGSFSGPLTVPVFGHRAYLCLFLSVITSHMTSFSFSASNTISMLMTFSPLHCHLRVFFLGLQICILQYLLDICTWWLKDISEFPNTPFPFFLSNCFSCI